VPTSPLGLFPLQLVLLPGEVIPLHVFEPRYQRLLSDVRAYGREFGIVLLQDDVMAETGCSAALVEVIEEFDDGRLNILIEGRRRFRVEEVRMPAEPELDYMSGIVEYFDDETDSDAPPELNEQAARLFLRLLALIDVEKPRTPAGSNPLSFRFASAVDFGSALKQRLLEARSEADRLATLVAVMEALIPRLELRREREDAIDGNGKGY
jgi:Lon protease-like protein